MNQKKKIMGKKRFWSSPHLYYKPLSLKAPFDKTVVKITPFYVDYLTLSSFKTGQTNLQKKNCFKFKTTNSANMFGFVLFFLL